MNFMKIKKLITITLLVFVSVCIGYLVLNNTLSRKAPESLSGSNLSANEAPDKIPPSTESPVTPVSTDKVVAQYFHGTTRCDTCRAIEAFTREALETGFNEELKTGRLEIQSINLDESANGHFVEDYQLTTRTVVISRFEDGKQEKWKRLDQVWNLVRDKKAFLNYVQTETRTLLEQNS